MIVFIVITDSARESRVLLFVDKFLIAACVCWHRSTIDYKEETEDVQEQDVAGNEYRRRNRLGWAFRARRRRRESRSRSASSARSPRSRAASISKAAHLAAEEINAKGGVDGRQIQIIAYDNHSSASDGVRAFQRAASQDKVVAIIGSYISEVALAMEPWSARLKMPFITPGRSEQRHLEARP